MVADPDLTPQARAAKVTWLLVRHGELTTQQICDLTGLTDVAARFLMNNLSLAHVPYYKPMPGRWRLMARPDGTIVDSANLRIVDR